MTALEIWKVTGFRFMYVQRNTAMRLLLILCSVKDHLPTKRGHMTRFWCSQDSARRKRAKPSQKPSITHRDNVGMECFECISQLNVSCHAMDRLGYHKVTILLNHHQNHKPNYDVAMPLEAIALICENLEWTTPVSMVPQIQAIHPNVTPAQVHRAWTEMSETLWKCEKDQLSSAKILLNEYRDDVDVFEIDVQDGVQQLCWGMKKILAELKGKVIEIAVDATCKSLGSFR